ENLIDSYQLVFAKWIRIYTKKVRKSDMAKGFRFRDDDHVLLRLERFIRTQEKIDFSAYAASANAAELNYRLKLYKRENRDHHTMFNRGRKISKPERIPSDDQEILASDRFKERYGSFLRAVSIEDKTIAKWQRLIANIGMENIFKFLISDGEKWSRTQTWHSAGEPDLFISKNGCSYFCEVKSPNDRIHQSQRDFMEYVAKGSGIDYIVCNVKPLV
ncbi:VRR-NUC domain-containing protein, partial [Pseudooctadecabacter sp.]|uniref:VRR-NUC domain-containing protein n=1 Tax=Pseudooctadecabacter sp. TaxID=1966338 RepID=UPI003F6D512C